jgi:adenine-specific DNA-methyltransferase
MKAGAIGECPVVTEDTPNMLVLPKNKFAVLTDERYFMEFV